MLKLHHRPPHPEMQRNAKWWFTLTAHNGKILMTSEMYNTKRAAQNGMRAVRRWASEQ